MTTKKTLLSWLTGLTMLRSLVLVAGVTVAGVTGAALLLTGAITMAEAQTTPEATPESTAGDAEGGTPGLAVEKTPIRVQPMVLTDVPLNEPVAIDLGSLVIPGVAAEMTRGVLVKGYTRYVEFEGRRIAQMVLTGVERGGVSAPLPAGLFNAQFDLDDPRLEPGVDLVVEGDAAAMIAALEKLAEAGTEEEVAGEEEAVASEAVVPGDTASGQSSGQSSGQGQNSSAGTGNELAGSYQAPESVDGAVAASAESINITTQGCPVRIDVAQLEAFQQSRTETVRGGAVVDQSACSDSETSYPLQKSYSVCTDVVDLEALTATAHYVLYYTDAGGARQEVNDCTPDPETVFSIVEKPEACTTYLDYTALQAVPQSALVYSNGSNAEVQVRGCQASSARAAVDLVQATDTCTLRHDFAGGLSHRQGAWIYDLDGVRYQAGGCVDTDVSYTHILVHDGPSGGLLCAPVVNLATNTVVLQGREQITVDGVSQFVSDCTPDASGTSLVSTTAGCENPFSWHHDLSAGQSYGEERFYFTHNGIQEYVTDCVQGGAVYTHEIETTGWQDHDDQLFSHALSTVYITTPGGRYDVVVSQVLSGAVQQPYELTGTAVRENGTIVYEDCSKFLETSTVELWERPGGDIYEKPTGSGARLGPLEACTTVLTQNWPKISQTVVQPVAGTNTVNCGGQGPGYHWGWQATTTGYYDGSRLVTREDGVVVTDETVTRTIVNQSACSSPVIPQAGPVPDPAGLTQSNTWMTELGWLNN